MMDCSGPNQKSRSMTTTAPSATSRRKSASRRRRGCLLAADRLIWEATTVCLGLSSSISGDLGLHDDLKHVAATYCIGSGACTMARDGVRGARGCHGGTQAGRRAALSVVFWAMLSCDFRHSVAFPGALYPEGWTHKTNKTALPGCKGLRPDATQHQMLLSFPGD